MYSPIHQFCSVWPLFIWPFSILEGSVTSDIKAQENRNSKVQKRRGVRNKNRWFMIVNTLETN
jgi:hypothetical protein